MTGLPDKPKVVTLPDGTRVVWLPTGEVRTEPPEPKKEGKS